MSGQYEQMRHWHVCQVCGDAKPAMFENPNWLVADHITVEDLVVVRCPRHWSEWALRQTVLRRTNASRAKCARMQALAKRARPRSPFAPFPALDEPIIESKKLSRI